MALNREERKLLHQKATQPTFGNNKPDNKQGSDGDVSYRRIEGSGLVQFVKKDGKWNAIGSTGNKPESRVIGLSSSISSSGSLSSHGSLIGLIADDHKQYLLVSGSRAMSGNLNMGTNDVGSVGALDVDGHTTLDQVTVNTTDGAFAVSGANPITLTTTGSNDIDIVSNQTLDVNIGLDYELDVTRNCDWNTTVTDWDNSGTFDLTSIDNMTIETSGASTAKTILIQNTNNHGSDFTGIHIKTSSQGASSAFNGILIECDNIAGKGGTAGVDVRSENGIRIRAENDNAGGTTGLLMRATGPIDIGVGSSLTAHSSDSRVKVHGTNGIEFAVLYRADGSSAINTTNATWDKIDTLNLVRAMTYKASDATLASGSLITIVTGVNDDNIEATIWRVAVYWNHGSSNPNFQLWHCFATTSGIMNVVKDAEVLSSGAGGTLAWSSGDSGGIKWRNDHASSNADVKASALKIQSGNDF